MRIKRAFLLLALLSPLLAACVYKMDIRQGNFVTPDMREKLKVGMTKAQVKYVLGTPMISDPFHASRWDYAYLLQHEGKVTEQQRMTLYFVGDNLERIVDGEQPVAPQQNTVPQNTPQNTNGQVKG